MQKHPVACILLHSLAHLSNSMQQGLRPPKAFQHCRLEAWTNHMGNDNTQSILHGSSKASIGCGYNLKDDFHVAV